MFAHCGAVVVVGGGGWWARFCLQTANYNRCLLYRHTDTHTLGWHEGFTFSLSELKCICGDGYIVCVAFATLLSWESAEILLSGFKS